MMKKFFQINKFINIFAGFILAIIVYSFCQNILELKAYDLFSVLSLNQKASNQIINITIDNQSLKIIGRWPWPRSNYINIFEYLQKYGKAKAILFDAKIDIYGQNQDDTQFFNKLKSIDNFYLGFLFSKKPDYFDIMPDKNFDSLIKKNYSIEVTDKRNPEIIKKTEYKSSSYVLKELMNRVSLGSVMVNPDRDGIIRKYEPIIYYQGSYYPSLALTYILKENKINNLIFQNNFLKFSDKTIPIKTTPKGSFYYIKWYQPYDRTNIAGHQTISAWKILKSYDQIKKGEEPFINPEFFNNKIIVFGATATALHDIKLTPLSSNYPGLDIQSTILDNFLNNNFMTKAPLCLNLVILLIMSIIPYFLVTRLKPLYSSMIILIMVLSYLIVAINCYFNNFAIDVATPVVFVFLMLIVGYAKKYSNENFLKAQVKQILSKYVSSSVMEAILKNINNVGLGGKRVDATILFADIRNFTAISEKLEPEEVSEVLNQYFGQMVPVVLKYNGLLNKFMGDAILAVFGAPVENSNHASDAVKCAIEMLEKLAILKEKFKEQDKPDIEIGIGINSGTVFAGHIGTEDRLEYTVIGDAVNLASRLENFNKVFNTHILISEYTYKKINTEIEVKKINSVTIKGKSQPMDVYEVIKAVKANDKNTIS